MNPVTRFELLLLVTMFLDSCLSRFSLGTHLSAPMRSLLCFSFCQCLLGTAPLLLLSEVFGLVVQECARGVTAADVHSDDQSSDDPCQEPRDDVKTV